MDIVICVAYKDCLFFKKNIYFIEKNLKPECIYVITRQTNFYLLKNLSKRILLLDEDSLVPELNFKNIREALLDHLGINLAGWYFQQFLKMAFSLTKYARKCYLVWDSDTVPLNSLLFFDENGRYYFMPKTEHHNEYFCTIDKLFKANKKASYSFISEHMVFDVAIMKELITKIDHAEIAGSPIDANWFIKTIYAITPGTTQGFSEFETYGTYCLNYHPEIFTLRQYRTFRRGSLIYGIFASCKEIDSLKSDLDTCSFELYDYPVSMYRHWLQFIYYWYCRFKNRIRKV